MTNCNVFARKLDSTTRKKGVASGYVASGSTSNSTRVSRKGFYIFNTTPRMLLIFILKKKKLFRMLLTDALSLTFTVSLEKRKIIPTHGKSILKTCYWLCRVHPNNFKMKHVVISYPINCNCINVQLVGLTNGNNF